MREAFFFQIEADVVGADVGEIGEGLIETEDEEDGGVNAEGDLRRTFFDAGEGSAADHGALGHEGGRDPPASARVSNVFSQFFQGALDAEGEGGEGVGSHLWPHV